MAGASFFSTSDSTSASKRQRRRPSLISHRSKAEHAFHHRKQSWLISCTISISTTIRPCERGHQRLLLPVRNASEQLSKDSHQDANGRDPENQINIHHFPPLSDQHQNRPVSRARCRRSGTDFPLLCQILRPPPPARPPARRLHLRPAPASLLGRIVAAQVVRGVAQDVAFRRAQSEPPRGSPARLTAPQVAERQARSAPASGAAAPPNDSAGRSAARFPPAVPMISGSGVAAAGYLAADQTRAPAASRPPPPLCAFAGPAARTVRAPRRSRTPSPHRSA